MDRLTKSAQFLAVWMTFTLEEFSRLYIREIFQLHGVLVSIVSDKGPKFTIHFWKSFLKFHGDIVDNEHNISSSDRWSVREDHTNFRGHVACTCPGSHG